MYKQVVVICVRSHFSHCKINTRVDYRENKRNKLLIQLQLEESQYYVKQKQLQESTYCMISLMNSGNNEKNLFAGNQDSDCFWWGKRCGLTANKHKGTFSCDEHVPYLHLVNKYMDVYIFTNFRYILKISAFCCIELVFHLQNKREKSTEKWT